MRTMVVVMMIIFPIKVFVVFFLPFSFPMIVFGCTRFTVHSNPPHSIPSLFFHIDSLALLSSQLNTLRKRKKNLSINCCFPPQIYISN